MPGDRPIEITLQRAWAALSWRQRWQLLRALWQSRGEAADVSADAVEAMKDDDVISSVLAEYSAAFPEACLQHNCLTAPLAEVRVSNVL